MVRKFLLTRDLENSLKTKESLENLGLSVEIYPLCEIEIIKNLEINWQNYKNIILTSKNALKSLPIKKWQEINKAHKFLIIGTSFAEFLQENQMLNYQSFNETSELLKSITPTENYLYLRAKEVSQDLAKAFPDLIDEIIIYQVNYLKIDQKIFNNFLKEKQITDALFLSDHNAKKFLSIISKENLEKLQIFCLSKRIAKNFSISNTKISYPKITTFKAMLILL